MVSIAGRIFAILLLASIFAVALPADSAQADIAPPQQPPGSSLGPGRESTRVRMLAETVLIEVRPDAPEGSLGQARVTATFTMQNQGAETEAMAVRFPISVNDGFFRYPELEELEVFVDGERVPIRLDTVRDEGDDPITWAEFDLAFPPGEQVTIDVSYMLEGTGEYPFISLTYLLETGAGWEGPISEVDIILRLPYEASPQNVIFDEQIGWSLTSPEGEIAGDEVRWHFENLEPTRADNLQVSLVMPSTWAVVLRERDLVAAQPNDGEAWGRLGKIYKEIIYLRRWMRSDPGGLELYDLSKQAYQRSVDLLPEDAWWHAGYAELLWRGAIDPFHPRGLDDLLLTLRELDRALQLDPDNELSLEILDWLEYEFPGAVVERDGGYRFAWLTATPVFTTTPTFTVEPSLTPTQTRPTKPSSTSLPPTSPSQTALLEDPTSTPTGGEAQSLTATAPDEEGDSSLQVCGVALVVPLLLLGVVALRQVRHP